MRLYAILAGGLVAFAVSASVKVAHSKPPPDECTCVLTFSETDVHREHPMCDGFNAATHAQCKCEIVSANGQPWCRPKNQSGVHGGSAGFGPLPRSVSY
jgi:hypothetical protein